LAGAKSGIVFHESGIVFPNLVPFSRIWYCFSESGIVFQADMSHTRSQAAPTKGAEEPPEDDGRGRGPAFHPDVKSSFSTTLICTSNRGIPASASTNPGPKKGELIPL